MRGRKGTAFRVVSVGVGRLRPLDSRAPVSALPRRGDGVAVVGAVLDAEVEGGKGLPVEKKKKRRSRVLRPLFHSRFQRGAEQLDDGGVAIGGGAGEGGGAVVGRRALGGAPREQLPHHLQVALMAGDV